MAKNCFESNVFDKQYMKRSQITSQKFCDSKE